MDKDLSLLKEFADTLISEVSSGQEDFQAEIDIIEEQIKAIEASWQPIIKVA